jgi:serine phosphatase RsbU (regulator of sigma subunit)
LLPNITFKKYQINFNKGDRVLALLDGVRACPSLDLDMFGEKGLEKLCMTYVTIKVLRFLMLRFGT